MTFTTGKSLLPVEVSKEILNLTQNYSVIQNMVPRKDIVGRETGSRSIAGTVSAKWVGEGETKPTDDVSLKLKTYTPYKLAVITTVTTEALEDDEELMKALVNELPAALSKKFDETVLGSTTPGTGFDVLGGSDVPTVAVKEGKHYEAALGALRSVSSHNANLSGFLINSQQEADVLGELDANGRPIFLNSVVNDKGFGSILGRPVNFTNRLDKDTFAIAGDWANKAQWGTTASDLQIAVNDSATVNGVNLWENNLVAIRAEQRIYFSAEAEAFVRLTNPTTARAK